jgi:hypothetical protein
MAKKHHSRKTHRRKHSRRVRHTRRRGGNRGGMGSGTAYTTGASQVLKQMGGNLKRTLKRILPF